jgi:hypothetical protein
LKLEHLQILNQHHEQYISNIITCQKIIKGFLARNSLLRKAKQNANERHTFITQVYLSGKRTMEKLKSLPKVCLVVDDRMLATTRGGTAEAPDFQT